MTEQRRILAVCDASAGNRRQAEALAAAVAKQANGAAETLVIAPTAPWRWLSPYRLPLSAWAFDVAFRQQLRKPPDIAIGCGRQAALATRLLRSAGSRVVQILDPRIAPSNYDLVIVPEHDGLSGDNVITTLGSLNPVDDDWLAEMRQRFARFAALPSPRILLALGGPTKTWPLDELSFERIADAVSALHARLGGSLLVTTSPRSPDWLRDAVQSRLCGLTSELWLGDAAAAANPYPGFLAWADLIIATPDSANLLSEAAATGAPLLCPPWPEQTGKLSALVAALHARKNLTWLPDAKVIVSDGVDLAEQSASRSTLHQHVAELAAEVSRRLQFSNRMLRKKGN
ncbi:MAG: mitochondrial fission ELM1 family protein [Xanthomonadales bacterium]|nr:mitochondrial fission ELM1 family protein [Xanthomonadales bacterium]